MLLWDMSTIYSRSLSKPSPESLLDTYQVERHPVAAGVLRYTRSRFSGRMPVQRPWETLLNSSCPMNSQAIAAEVSGLSVRYDLGEGLPLVLNLGGPGGFDITTWQTAFA